MAGVGGIEGGLKVGRELTVEWPNKVCCGAWPLFFRMRAAAGKSWRWGWRRW